MHLWSCRRRRTPIPRQKSNSVASVPFNRRALRAGTAIASAIRNALAIAPAQAFVAPPVDGQPVAAEPVAGSPPGITGRVRRLMQPGSGPDNDLRRNDPPRLMPSDAGRHVNAMPSHAMAAGGRPMIIKIPGK